MSELSVRRPAVAGQFYPGDPNLLQKKIQSYLDDATLPDDLGTTRAIIAPHAGYVYSGPTAGYAFKALKQLPTKAWTAFLLGPAHHVPVAGVALGNYSAFRTPLGDVPIAADRIAEMLKRSSLYVRAPQAHTHEHCLEVEVPFLQMTLSDFHLVPMLFGRVDPSQVAADLTRHIGEHDLIVVSSDLSHFHSYSEAQQLDRSFLDALLEGTQRGVLRGEACGRAPVATLMDVASDRGWKPHLLDYRTSGDTAGSRFEVVGYASVAYTG